MRVEGDVVCCYARQDKHWVTGPDGQEWENYVVLADAHPELEGRTCEMGGAEGTRTPDPLIANEVRYQLRHSPLRRARVVRREAKG